MTLLLAIDGGGTRTRCLAIDRDGAVRGDGLGGPSNHLHVPIAEATQAIRDAVAGSLSTAGATRDDVELVSAGLAGVDFDGTGKDEGEQMLRACGFGQVVVNGDMVIAHRGALGGGPGVMALAGTGSSVLGIGADGTMTKAGGWGPLYGDQGSAFQIGRMGLTAAAEAFDGAGPRTELLARLTTALGISAFPQTIERLYNGASSQQPVAALAAVVDACARDGDDVATAICRRAGSDLARAVLAVVRRLSMPKTLVSYQGAVLEQSALVRGAFVDALERAAVGVVVRPPRFEPIAGAALIGAAAAGWQIDPASWEVRHGV
jgi:glucosamine kinase